MTWKVSISRKAVKKAKNLSEEATAAFYLLWRELENKGPIQASWPNFSKLKRSKNEYHCHLNKKRPTYVVCWRGLKYSKKEREQKNEDGEIEIFYAWTHENAPY